MIEYLFTYNLPQSNSKWHLVDTQINVRATLLPDDNISVEFVMLGAGTLCEVLNWNKAITEIKEIAAQEFQMMIAIRSASKLVA